MSLNEKGGSRQVLTRTQPSKSRCPSQNGSKSGVRERALGIGGHAHSFVVFVCQSPLHQVSTRSAGNISERASRTLCPSMNEARMDEDKARLPTSSQSYILGQQPANSHSSCNAYVHIVHALPLHSTLKLHPYQCP